MAVMADFARLPTERKVLVFVVGAALLGLVYFQFGYKPLKAELAEAKGEHDTKVALNAKLEREIPEFADIKRDIVKLRDQINANDKALPTEAELPAFFETLNRKVTEAGVEVTKWKEGTPASVESFVRVPIEIEMTGTYMQIERFFASLLPKKRDKSAPKTDQPEELDRIVSIENLSLSNPVVRNREIVLTAKFTAATFRQELKKPPAPGQPGAAGAAPAGGAPALPAPRPAPMPANPPQPTTTPATPAAVKAAADNAMQKDEARTRNAPTGDGSGKPKGSL